MPTVDRAMIVVLLLIIIAVLGVWLGIGTPIIDAVSNAQRSDWLGFVGNIVGACMTLLAAGVAWAAVQHQIRDVQAREERAREQRDKAEALSIFVKLNQIMGSLHTFNDTIQEARAVRENSPVNNREPWGYVKPLATLPDRQHISSGEKALLVLRNKVDLFNELGRVDDTHNHYRDLLALFAAKRNELTNKIPPHQILQGPAFMTYPSQEQMLEIAPLIAELNQIVLTLEAELPLEVIATTRMLEDLTAWINCDFGTKLKIMGRADQS